jgi:hypothetical protein
MQAEMIAVGAVALQKAFQLQKRELQQLFRDQRRANKPVLTELKGQLGVGGPLHGDEASGRNVCPYSAPIP